MITLGCPSYGYLAETKRNTEAQLPQRMQDSIMELEKGCIREFEVHRSHHEERKMEMDADYVKETEELVPSCESLPPSAPQEGQVK